MGFYETAISRLQQTAQPIAYRNRLSLRGCGIKKLQVLYTRINLLKIYIIAY